MLAGLAARCSQRASASSQWHPSEAEEGDAEFTDKERYRLIRNSWRRARHARGGLHVHVGMPDAQTAIAPSMACSPPPLWSRWAPTRRPARRDTASPRRANHAAGVAAVGCAARDADSRTSRPRPGGSPRLPACPTTRFTGGSCGPIRGSGRSSCARSTSSPRSRTPPAWSRRCTRSPAMRRSPTTRFPARRPRSSRRLPSAPPGPGSTPRFPTRRGACDPWRSCSRRPSSLCGSAARLGCEQELAGLFDLMEQACGGTAARRGRRRGRHRRGAHDAAGARAGHG